MLGHGGLDWAAGLIDRLPQPQASPIGWKLWGGGLVTQVTCGKRKFTRGTCFGRGTTPWHPQTSVPV